MKNKKYEIELLNNGDERFLLLSEGFITFIASEEENEGYWKQYYTESEIKAIDERYWQFAVPVEETHNEQTN